MPDEQTCRIEREELLGLLDAMSANVRKTAELPAPRLEELLQHEPRFAWSRARVIGASFAVTLAIGLLVHWL